MTTNTTTTPIGKTLIDFLRTMTETHGFLATPS